MSNCFDEEVDSLGRSIPPGHRLVVVGSTLFWGEDSADLCHRLAVRLAEIADLVALTGGMSGVGETFGRTFAGERRRLSLPERLYHLLPRGFGASDTGVTLFGGADFEERREILGRLGRVYLVVEGGPGTEHEVRVALGRGAVVLPVGRTGGHAAEILPVLKKPSGVESADWDLLGDRTAPPDAVVSAVRRLVEMGFRRPA